jgi:putative membrane protein
MMGFGFLRMLLIGGLLLALLVGGAGLVLRETGGSSQGQGGLRQPTARQVLDERFARGEIGREEYEAIRAQIER